MSESVCKKSCPDMKGCKGEFCRNQALEIYKHTLVQRSTMFRFYLGILGFYFAGIFFIIDRFFNRECKKHETLLLLLSLTILGWIAARISYKFELASSWAHNFIEGIRDKYKFPNPQNDSNRKGGYYKTFQYIYKLGRVIGWSIFAFSLFCFIISFTNCLKLIHLFSIILIFSICCLVYTFPLNITDEDEKIELKYKMKHFFTDFKKIIHRSAKYFFIK